MNDDQVKKSVNNIDRFETGTGFFMPSRSDL